MSRLTFGLAAAVAGLVLAPNLASALSAVTATSTDLRAGPAYDFPVVDQIPGDVRVNVHGCVRGYRWCDVSWRDARGWVSGQELAYLYEGRRVTIVEYGPRIGLPVVGFAFDTYWDRYYRGRSWYGERARWRTVWRDHERNDGRAGDNIKSRPQGETRRETFRRNGDESERDRRVNRTERPEVRTGRGERDRGETKGYGYNPTPRDTNRGMNQGGERAAPMVRDRGPASQGGAERGGHQGGSERGHQGGSDKGGRGHGDNRP